MSENVDDVLNNQQQIQYGRSDKSDMDVLDQLTDYIKSHEDVVATLPGDYLQGTTLTMSPRNIDDNEINFSLKFGDEKREGKSNEPEEEGTFV